MKAVIVDDSQVMREHLVEMLASLSNIEIVEMTEEPQQAIEAIRSSKPDLVILDIRLSGGSGIDVLKAIKNDNHHPTVIVYTNYPFPQYKTKCMDAGAEFFFDKSTESQQMISTIESIIKRFQSRDSTGNPVS